MSKEKEATVSPAHSLMQSSIYKRTQGRMVRQVTFFALAIALAWGLYELSIYLLSYRQEVRFGIPVLLFAVGLWLCYRLVNMPRFADFLIGVEAEMNKVSWPSQSELVRSCIVVIFVIFFLAALLFAYDSIWRWLLSLMGVWAGGDAAGQ